MDFVDQLVDSFAELGRDIGNVVPRIVVALLLLLIGHWIAKWIRRLITAGLNKVGAGRLTEAAGLEDTLRSAGTSGVALVGQVVYFLIFLVFIQLAAEVLGIDQLTQMLNQLIAYLPLVIVALLVLFIAAAIASWAARVVRPLAEDRGMGWLATVVRVAILVVGVLAALDTLNFAPSVTAKIENTLLQYLPLSVLVAATIAFGIGGIDTAKQWWRKLSPRPSNGSSWSSRTPSDSTTSGGTTSAGAAYGATVADEDPDPGTGSGLMGDDPRNG
jgi:hypothetical protein